MMHPLRIMWVFLLLIVSIQGFEINLVNGSTELKGRIEVYCSGRWLALCLRNLNNNMANQICRDLGFSDINAKIVEDPTTMFGLKTPSLPTVDMNCVEETEPCQPSNLTCSEAQCKEWDVAIDSSSSEAMARVCQGRTWKYVQHCTNNYTASAFCKQSGYSNYGSYSMGVTLSSHQLISTFNCLGNETHLSECPEESCEGNTNVMASHIFCQEPCHRCNQVMNHLTAQISGSTAHLNWTFNSEITSSHYYIANCSSKIRKGTTPVASINRILTSSLATSVRMTGIQGNYDYLCCVTAKRKGKGQFDYTVCSDAVRDKTFELPGSVGTVFFYLFLIILFFVVMSGVIAGLIIRFMVKRGHKKSKKVAAADFNKVLSQSIMSLNDKGKKKDNLELSIAKLAANSTTHLQSTKPSEELVKSSTLKGDKEETRQEYSVLSRVEKNEDKSLKVNPCVAYGKVQDNSSSPDYRDMEKSSTANSKDTVTQYYEDI